MEFLTTNLQPGRGVLNLLPKRILDLKGPTPEVVGLTSLDVRPFVRHHSLKRTKTV